MSHRVHMSTSIIAGGGDFSPDRRWSWRFPGCPITNQLFTLQIVRYKRIRLPIWDLPTCRICPRTFTGLTACLTCPDGRCSRSPHFQGWLPVPAYVHRFLTIAYVSARERPHLSVCTTKHGTKLGYTVQIVPQACNTLYTKAAPDFFLGSLIKTKAITMALSFGIGHARTIVHKKTNN